MKPWELYTSGRQRPSTGDPHLDELARKVQQQTGGTASSQEAMPDYEYTPMYPHPAGDPRNQEIYDSRGKPHSIFGIETGLPIRIEETERGREFVMPPPANNPHDFSQGAIGRTIVGAGIEAVHGAAQIGDLILGVMPGTGQAMKDTGISLEGLADEILPHMGQDNLGARIAQEAVGMLAGGGIGAKGAQLTSDALKLAEHLTPMADRMLRVFRSKDMAPEEGMRLTRDYLQKYIKMQGFDIGMGAATPEHMEPLSQQIGLPEEIGPLNERQSDTVGHIIDNLAFSHVLGFFGEMIKGGGRLVGSGLEGFSNKADLAKLTIEFMKRVDPMINTSTSGEEFASRIKLFGDIASKNAEFRTGLMMAGREEIVSLDSLGAMKQGITEYVQRAYPSLDQPQANSLAQQIMNNLAMEKRGRKMSGSTTVVDSDAAIAHDTGRILEGQADQLASETNALHAGQAMGADVVVPINEARDAARTATQNLNIAEASHSALINEQELSYLLNQAKEQNLLGSSQAEKDNINSMAADALVREFQERFFSARNAYDNVQNDIPNWGDVLDELSNRVNAAQQYVNEARTLQLNTGPTPMRPVSGLAEALEVDPVTLLRAELDNARLDTRALSRIYTQLSEFADKARSSGSANRNTNANALVSLRDFVKSQLMRSPSYREADTLWRQFKDEFAVTSQLDQWSEKARQTLARNDLNKGWGDMLEGAVEASESLINAKHPSVFQHGMSVLRNGNQEFDEAYNRYALGMVIRAMQDAPNESQALINAAKTQLDHLQRINPEEYDKFLRQIRNMRESELTLGMNQQAAKDAKAYADKLLTEAQDLAAARFIGEISHEGHLLVTSNPKKAYADLFGHAEAGTIVRKLILEASRRPDAELVLNGIRSQYLRFLRDRGFTNSSIAVAPGGTSTIKDMGAGFSNMQKDNTFEVLQAVFSGDKETADKIETLIREMSGISDLSKLRPHTTGSDTQFNRATAARSATFITKMLFGPLTRIGTVVNTIIGLFTKDRETFMKELGGKILDELIVDPNFLRRATEYAAADASGQTFMRFLMNTIGSGVKITQATGSAAFKPHDANIEDETDRAFSIPDALEEVGRPFNNNGTGADDSSRGGTLGVRG
jgi:hypothetical protein